MKEGEEMAWSVKRAGGGRERMIAQTRVDARLDAQFEQGQSGEGQEESSERARVNTYLQRMQKGMEIQPLGCLLVVADGQGFALLAHSDNAPEMLHSHDHQEQEQEDQQQTPHVFAIGMDARTLFSPASVAELEKVAASADLQLLNPLLLRCASSGRSFYALVHRIEAGLVMDLEPMRSPDVELPVCLPVSSQLQLQSYRLASRAISRLQCLPGGNIALLCEIVVQEVREMTGYDRVMAYRFHDDDDHGEVVAEMRRPDLEPYLGLHYPATDIPQASRFLFMKNRVRMICDCRAPAVKVRQDKKMGQALSLSGSTLRAPYGCHAQYMANMGSIASLVMAVTVSNSEGGGRRLWGLVVCHHTTPRFVPYPLRYACEFLMQVFGVQLNKEVQLAARLRERHILRTQTVLCDMLLRDAPVGIVTKTPNIMDLVKCDGAALLYGKRLWLLGTTPTEAQIHEIADWLLEHHKDSTGLSTDSLAEAGFPGAASLGDAVCGIAAARITSKDFLFWFRSHTAKEIKWGGAKHDPDDKDDGMLMHPRSSFKAFLEVVKRRSILWEDVEMDAIHSLQLILRDSFQEIDDNDTKAMIYAGLNDLKIQGIDALSAVTNEMVRLIETATVPILAVDADGLINGWNIKAAELTGFSVDQVIGKPLIDLIKEDSIETAKNMLFLALQGEEEQNVEIKLKTFGAQEETGSVILIVNACSSKDLKDNVAGVCFIAQDVTRQKVAMDKFTRIQGDYRAIVQNPSPLIPPIFGTDEYGYCSEWNAAMEKLSGWQRKEIIGKTLVGGVFGVHPICCQLKSQDALTKLSIVLNGPMTGKEVEKFPFSFFDCHGKNIDTLLSANKRTDAEGRITGVFCFLHVTSPELQQALQVQHMSEQAAISRLRELAYFRQEIRNPLYGIMFTQKLIESTTLTELQKQIVQTSSLCQQQLVKILDDLDLDSIEDGYLELDTVEFTLGAVFDAVISQGMILSRVKGLQLLCDSTEEIKTMHLFGDQLRLQQVLSEFLLNALRFTPPEGWVEIKVIPNKKHLGIGLHIMHLEFRVTHPGQGIPDELIKEMFDHDQDMTREGLGLHICHKLVKIMNGEVKYCREVGSSSFILTLELPSVQSEEQ
uniref:Phytochrome n=1 Tax=Taiwania cryptomerioides TaxID=50187 RepID=A0A059UJR2_TAICR|nr:phytochrome [Taiwania cryptomerioides]